MYSFKNDYSEGAHKNILNAIANNNFIQMDGYGEDIHCLKAAEIIREKIGESASGIYFLVGGTQTNLTFISSVLRPYQAVISPSSGHILVHETGAIEATGHKIISMPSEDGKLTVTMIQETLEFHTDCHMVMPKLVYISNSTEVGTIYKKAELTEISNYCRKNDLFLYMDGARLGAALCSEDNDLTLKDISNLCDAFYIGGTKNGALLGEALVIINKNLDRDFTYSMKQKGALMAKGMVIGVQFEELFKNDLYFELANHANSMAMLLKKGIKELGYNFLLETTTNQIFPIFPNEIIEKLHENFNFYVWSSTDEKNSSVRLVTSWATKEENILEFLEKLKNILTYI